MSKVPFNKPPLSLTEQVALLRNRGMHIHDHGAAPAARPAPPILGGITSENEEEELEAANDWVKEQGLPDGILSYEYVDPDTGEQQAIFDLAWPHGIQEELSQPVLLLLNEPTETIALANRAGFRCFTSSDDLKSYVKSEILTEVDA